MNKEELLTLLKNKRIEKPFGLYPLCLYFLEDGWGDEEAAVYFVEQVLARGDEGFTMYWILASWLLLTWDKVEYYEYITVYRLHYIGVWVKEFCEIIDGEELSYEVYSNRVVKMTDKACKGIDSEEIRACLFHFLTNCTRHPANFRHIMYEGRFRSNEAYKKVNNSLSIIWNKKI